MLRAGKKQQIDLHFRVQLRIVVTAFYLFLTQSLAQAHKLYISYKETSVTALSPSVRREDDLVTREPPKRLLCNCGGSTAAVNLCAL